MSKRSILAACVTRMKAAGLTGKGRDDAAAHFLAGASAALPDTFTTPEGGIKYVDVLEALSEVAEDD